jgi:hypothetical protein
VRGIVLLLGSAAVFAAAVLLPSLPAPLSAMGAVASGLLLALAASATLHPLTFVGGALGALFAGTFAAIAGPIADPVAVAALSGALLAAPAFLERTTRVPRKGAALLHVALALGAGAIAAGVAALFARADAGLRAISIAVAATAMLVPLIVRADDAVAHGLRLAAGRIREPGSALLARAAALRNLRAERWAPLSAPERRAWRGMVDLAIARVDAERRSQRAPTAYRGEQSPDDPTLALDARIAEGVAWFEAHRPPSRRTPAG